MFNFPYLCRRYLTIRNTHIRHIECKYEFYNKKNQKTITYNPNHKDFWIFNENNLIEKDLYHYFPVIYHLPTIINSLTQLNPQLPSSQNIHQNCKLPLKKLFITKNNHEKK
jgi:hypothetical protein